MTRSSQYRIWGLVFVALAAVAALAASLLYFSGRLSPVASAPRSIEEQVKRVEEVAYDDVQPYLEALVTVRSGQTYLCEVNNLHRLPDRDPLFEAISRLTLKLFADDGRTIRGYVTEQVADGDSPWGVFRIEALRREMVPYLERAKEATIRTVRDRQAQQGARENSGPEP